jgi:DNA-directed RNA polymerase specialized sigma24 family protein
MQEMNTGSAADVDRPRDIAACNGAESGAPAGSVSQKIHALKSGDEEAAAELWDRYFNVLVQVARRQLGAAPRRVADEEDVALSVFDSLCRGASRGRFIELTDRDDLWKLLLKITRQKTVDHLRRAGRQKRGGGEVRGDSVFLRAGGNNKAAGFDALPGDVATPEFLALADEQYRRLLNLLADDTLRAIAAWKLEAFTNDEIADKLGISLRSVERKLGLIREAWSSELLR